MKKYNRYGEIVKEYGDDIVIIDYPFRWGGQFSDKSFWCATFMKTMQVYDYHLKDHLIKDCTKKGYKWIVVRNHLKNKGISIMEMSDKIIVPNQNSASQVVNDGLNISLKTTPLAPSKLPTATSLNNNIHRLHPNLKKCSKRGETQ